MLKSKITSLFNYLIIIIFIIALLYTYLYINFNNKKSKYDLKDSSFQLKIIDIYIDGNYLKLTLKGKEKLIGNYYFSSLEEKNKFIKEFELGTNIKVIGNLEVPNNNTNPNTFNYKEYLRTNNIFYVLKISNYEKLSNNKNVLYTIKNFIIKHIFSIKKSYPYLYTFILGNSNYIDSDIMSKYQLLGISHLFAISGMHISLISSLLLIILNKHNKKELIIITFILFFMSPSLL